MSRMRRHGEAIVSVLDLSGVADPVEHKRLIAQANKEMGNAGVWKQFFLIIACTIASGVFRDLRCTSPLWPGTPSSTRIYGWLGSFVIFSIGALLAYHSRRSERKAALVEILRSARRCTGCGYPVDEEPGSMCPECGNIRGCR